MKKTSRVNWYFLIIVLLLAIGPYGMRYIYRGLGITNPNLVMVISYFVLLVLPSIIYLAVTKSNVKEVLRLNVIPAKQFAYCFLIGILCIPLGNCLSAIGLYFFNNNAGDVISALSQTTPLIIMLLVMSVMPAVVEEVNLRGIILNGYNNQSILAAAIINGLFFGIFHLDGHQFFYASVIGFVMAYVVRTTNSIYSSMLIHFTVNSFSVIVSHLLASSRIYEQAVAVAKTIDKTQLSLDSKITGIVSYLTVAICIMGLIFQVIKQIKKDQYLRSVNYQYMNMNYNMYQNNINNPMNNGMNQGYGNAQMNNGMNQGYSNWQMNNGGWHENVDAMSEPLINVPFVLIIIIYLVIMILNSLV